ncbi:MAG: cation:proton antiporter [Candidatus Bathyarchaeia archaeon]
MLEPVTLALILAGSIIVIGFLGNYVFERKNIPDMIILIILGMIIGPLSGLVNVGSIMSLAPYLSSLALVFILFDGGLAMNIYRIFAESPRATVLAVLSFGLSIAFTTLLMKLFIIPDVPIVYSILFGTILGGSSSIAVVPLVSKIHISEKCSTILNLESAISDILCIVFSLVAIEIALKGTVDVTTIGQSVASRFSTGIVLGLIFGIVWLSIFKKVARASYAYILTLAVVLLAYATSEILGGSGSLCSLLFGIVLGNEKEIYRMLKREKVSETVVDVGLKRFESEIAFLLRTFFFVYIGLMFTISEFKTIVIGTVLSFVLLLARFISVRIATFRSAELVNERSIMSALLTRGLDAAVLATLPMQYAEEDVFFKELYPLYINIAVLVILVTAVIATVGILLLRRKPQNSLKTS